MERQGTRPSALVFKSDNVAPICPEVLAAIAEANTSWAPSYGADDQSAALKRELSALFERDVEVWLCSTGTAANSLALSALCPPYGAVFCTEESHVATDECGAPQLFTGGAKIHLVPHVAGKIVDLAALEAAVDAHASMAPHWNVPSAVSISQLTECGTAYSLPELRALGDLCRRRGLRLHMDGARFANALAALGCPPADATWRAGVDVLTLGGTKNGAMAAEAVVFFDEALARDFAFRHKRGAQLLSKARFFAAQFRALLDGDLWLRNARAANAAARRLADAVRKHAAGGARLAYPPDGNEVFAHLPPAAADALARAGALFYPWGPPGGGLHRFVCSWATSEEETAAFEAALDNFFLPRA